MEDVNKLVKLRDELIGKREKLKEELKLLDETIEVLENIIKEKSYIPASELPKEEVKIEKEAKPTPAIPMRTVNLVKYKGEIVCYADIYDDRIAVHISSRIEMPTSDRLIKYLIREMEKYLEEDLKAQIEEKLPPSQRFFFSIDEDDKGNITRIEFIDHGREDRRRDLLGKIRWAVNRFLAEKEEI